jgi:outer membrane protein assembly factor BamA
MAGFAKFERHEGHFLTKVEVQTQGSCLDAQLLTELLSPVSAARSVREMHQRIVDSVKTLNGLKMFDQVGVKILPGSQLDTARVQYDFQGLRRWTFDLHMSRSREGGRLFPSLILRNIRGVADRTTANLEFKPNTKTWGLSLNHSSPAILPNSWSVALNYHIRQKQMDVNLHVLETGEAVTITSHSGSHAVILGRDVRTNHPYIDRASWDNLQKAILTSEKYYVAHEWRASALDEEETDGYSLRLRNEVAFGPSTRAHTVALTCSQFLPLHKSLVLELTGWWRWMPNWNFVTVHYSDRLRATYIKGFRSIGARNPPANKSLSTHSYAPGDSVGSTNVTTAEAKLHFRKTPLLEKFGLSPFLYGNVVGVGLEAGQVRAGLRGSVGLGVDWKTRLGRVEMTYAAKVVTREGDLPAELQVLYCG